MSMKPFAEVVASLEERIATMPVRDDPETPATCERCEDTRWSTMPDPDGRGGERCSCANDPDLDDRLERAGVPQLYRACSWATWKGERPTKALEWQAEPKGVLYLHGPQGRGKTHLGTAVLRELAAGVRGLWMHTPGGHAYCRADWPAVTWRDSMRLVDFLRSCVRDEDGDRERRQRQRVEQCEVLLLDDFHLARTDFAREVLDGIIRHRHAHCLPTIVTANASLVTLARERDPAIASRMRGCEVALTDGPDWRAA